MFIEFQIPKFYAILKFFTKSIIKQKLFDLLQGTQEADFWYANVFTFIMFVIPRHDIVASTLSNRLL